MAPSVETTADDATRDTLQAALDVFDGPDSATAPDGGHRRLKELAERHKQASAKAVLLVSGPGNAPGGGPGPRASPAELRGVVGGVEQTALALCGYCHGFTAGAGPSLKQSLKQLCTGVVRPTQELVAKLASGDAEALRRVLGSVWGACDELTRGPLDNKTCLFRQLADVMSGIKGAAKELDELCETSRLELGLGPQQQQQEEDSEQEGAAGTASAPEVVPEPAATVSCNGNGNGEAHGAAPGEDGPSPRSSDAGGVPEGGRAVQDGRAEQQQQQQHEQDQEGNDEEEEEEAEAEEEAEDDDDDFRDMGSLDPQELRTAEAAVELLAAAQAVMRLISRPLLQGPALPAGQSLDEWESLAWHGGKLRSASEALVACLYPPHDELDELQGESEAVSTTLELMLSELPSAEEYFGGEAAGAAVEAVLRQVEAAAGRMADELSRRGRPAGGA